MSAELDTTLEHDPLAFLQGGGKMGQLIRNHDWRNHELGPPEHWPTVLKSAISSVLNSGTAMHISWGENLLQFYNDAYTPVLTDGKHPAALGRSVRESYPEIWDFVGPLFDRVLNQGEAIAMNNANLMMYRDGVLRESFFSFSYSPLKSISGKICGVTAVCWETTEEALAKQREHGLHLLSEQLVAATTIEEVHHAVHCHIDGNRGGLPFLLWYERDEELNTWHLVKSCGISPDAPFIGELGAQEGHSPLGRAFDPAAPVACLLTLPDPVITWVRDPLPAMEIESIAIEPLHYVNYSTPEAWMVFGVGSHQPFDSAWKNFSESICRGIERAVRRIRAVEFERREGQRQFDAVMHLTLDAAQIGYWDLDLKTGTPKRSVLHDRIFGYDEPLAEWSYETFLEHVFPQDRERVDREFQTGLKGKAEWEIECRILRRDGALRWIWLHGDVLTDAADDVVRTLGIIIDVTDRKNAEQSMRESELRFAAAFEHAPIGKAVVGLDGRYLKVNRALCDFLGYSSAELLTRRFQSLTHGDDIEPGTAHVQRLLVGEISRFQIEKRYIHASGKIVPALLSVSLLRDDDHQPLYFIAQIQDITARKAAEREIERAMDRLNEAQRVGKIGDWEYLPATDQINWSPQLFELFGRDPNLPPPRDFAEHISLLDATDGPLQQQKFHLTIQSGQPQDYELVSRRSDGKPMHIHVLAEPVKDDSGTVIRIRGTAQDISARKWAEAESRQLADRLTNTLDSMGDAFITLDHDWCFTFVNRQAEQMLGRSRAELLGRNLWTTFPTAVGSLFEIEYRRAMADKVPVVFEEFFDLLDSYFSVRAYPSEHGLAVYFNDITQAKRAADALRASEEDFRKLAEAMPQIVWTTRADGLATYINQQWTDYTGIALEDSLGNNWLRAFHPDDQERAAARWKHATDTLGTYSIETRMRRADGVYRWWLIRGLPVRDAGGIVIKWFGTCTDIHDRKVSDLENTRINQELYLSEARVKRLNRVYAVLSEITALIVRKPGRAELYREACRVAVEAGDFRFAWAGILDRDASRLTTIASAGEVTDFSSLAPPEIFDCQPGSTSRAAQALQERQPQVVNDFLSGRPTLMKEALESRGIHSFALIPLVVEGEAIGVFALFAREAGFFDEEEMRLLQELGSNISLALENIDKQERFDYLAYYDPLTGLANRALFLDRAAQHLRSAISGGHKLAIFLIDLERFKNINDSLGRTAGDAVLIQVAKWLTLRGGDASLLARVGTNHFAALIPQVMPGGDLSRLIEQAMTAVETHPFVIEDAVLRTAAKVGVAVFPDDGNSAEILFQNAEAALKQAKASGDRYLFHSSTMTDSTVGKFGLENQLRRALDNEEFVLYYQPKANLATGKVTGAEALIRWNDPVNGLIPPGQFIPVLEETGLIHEVGRWAMRKAIEDYLRWCDAGLAGIRIAVNVSSLQLRSRVFVAQVAEELAIDPRAASGLEIEITESMIMGDINHGIASLQAIRDMGVTVALDDFGTGFSSLSYLARLPIDTLKIDRAFINEMDTTPEGLTLVSTIITLGHSLGHKVVAEGVETEEQSQLLRLIGCDQMQGFYFGRPVPTAAFEASYLIPSTK